MEGRTGLRVAGFVVALVFALGIGCHVDDSGPASEPAPTCSQLGGIWAVAIDYGGGWVVHQNWLIGQNGCELILTGDPPDSYGPSLDATPQSGFARDGFFHASWEKIARGCRYSTSVEPAVEGDTFTGDMLVNWNSDTGGDCGSGFRVLPVTGSRS
jgi:hypothetical protein